MLTVNISEELDDSDSKLHFFLDVALMSWRQDSDLSVCVFGSLASMRSSTRRVCQFTIKNYSTNL